MSDEKIPVRNISKVPDLATESEAREFWDTHEVTEEYLTTAGSVPEKDLPPTRPRANRTKPIAVRFDEDVLERLKQLADYKHKGYQTLLKEFVSERLYEEEKREGILK
ncbi:MAG: CopG family antitoxin [Rubrobacteraceae bacterium]